MWLEEKLLAQQIKLLIDNAAPMLPTQFKKFKRAQGYLILSCLSMVQEEAQC